MSGSISGEALARDWSLSFADDDFVNGKPVSARLGLAVQLKFFASRGFFVEDVADLPRDGVSYVPSSSVSAALIFRRMISQDVPDGAIARRFCNISVFAA